MTSPQLNLCQRRRSIPRVVTFSSPTLVAHPRRRAASAAANGAFGARASIASALPRSKWSLHASISAHVSAPRARSMSRIVDRASASSSKTSSSGRSRPTVCQSNAFEWRCTASMISLLSLSPSERLVWSLNACVVSTTAARSAPESVDARVFNPVARISPHPAKVSRPRAPPPRRTRRWRTLAM